MSSTTERPSAQILDFAEYRLRQAAKRRAAQPLARRRFLWGWPATGQMTPVEFASRVAGPVAGTAFAPAATSPSTQTRKF